MSVHTMFHISLTGAFGVTRSQGAAAGSGAGHRPVDIRGVKPRQVLAVLALAAGQPVTKEQLAERLWGASPPASWLATVESYVCVLRRALEVEPDARAVIATVRGGYALDRESVEVDLHRCLDEARQALQAEDHDRAIRHVEAMFAAVRGPVLADEPYAAWAEVARSRLRGAVIHSTLHAAELAFDDGDLAAARRLADVVLEWDPMCEQALRLAMRTRARDGHLNDALRLYQVLASTLTEEMGCDPDPATRDVYIEVLRATGSDALSEPAEARVLIDLLRRSLSASAGLRRVLSADIEGLAREVRAGFAA
jgi:DNA-binding SARP family transcriptional activator